MDTPLIVYLVLGLVISLYTVSKNQYLRDWKALFFSDVHPISLLCFLLLAGIIILLWPLAYFVHLFLMKEHKRQQNLTNN